MNWSKRGKPVEVGRPVVGRPVAGRPVVGRGAGEAVISARKK